MTIVFVVGLVFIIRLDLQGVYAIHILDTSGVYFCEYVSYFLNLQIISEGQHLPFFAFIARKICLGAT